MLSLMLSSNLLSILLQVHTYQRLTPFSILDHAVESLDNLRPGDCIVCFSKNDIYSISRQIEAKGLECAVIYGSLPPGECVKWSVYFYMEVCRPVNVVFEIDPWGSSVFLHFAYYRSVFRWFTGTKLFQAKKFNDPDDPCKILVATDAIGMGLNLWAQCYITHFLFCAFPPFWCSLSVCPTFFIVF